MSEEHSSISEIFSEPDLRELDFIRVGTKETVQSEKESDVEPETVIEPPSVEDDELQEAANILSEFSIAESRTANPTTQGGEIVPLE